MENVLRPTESEFKLSVAAFCARKRENALRPTESEFKLSVAAFNARKWVNMLLDLKLNLNPPFEAAFCARKQEKWSLLELTLKLNVSLLSQLTYMWSRPFIWTHKNVRLTQPLKLCRL